MVALIVGIDFATKPKNVGMARAERHGASYIVTDVVLGASSRYPQPVVIEWLSGQVNALLAIDAPLGWPTALSRELARHRAGQAVEVPSELLFRRWTDRVVADRTGKTPLDVGADRIARTAHGALLFLADIRRGLGEPLPLAWRMPLRERVEVIEVYPAATLLARGASLRHYKKSDGHEVRRQILELLQKSCECDAVRDAAIDSDHCLDAIACVVAGIDFVDGTTVAPNAPDIAEREGWIWFRESEGPPKPGP